MSSLFGYFLRPVGAAVDIKELEYISSLHQTSKELDPDGLINAHDVRIFLRSRFGIVVSADDAIDIVRGLSGTARLPLPEINEKKRFFQRKSNKVESDDDITHVRTNLAVSQAGAGSLSNGGIKQEPTEGEDEGGGGFFRNPLKRAKKIRLPVIPKSDDDLDDDIPEDDVEHQWNLLAKSSNMMRQWHFKSDAPKKKPPPKTVEKMVRYDLVQLLSFLLIPTLVRLQRHRFGEPMQERPPLPPRFEGSFWEIKMFWKFSSVAWYVLKFPYVWFHEMRRKRLVKWKDELLPKPASLFEDVLRILLGNLQNEDAPLSRKEMLKMFAASASVTTQGSYFPKLANVSITESLVRELLLARGEKKAALDHTLLREMVELVGGEGSILNERSFARALTADVASWPIECEDDVSTSFYDVFGFSENECNHLKKEVTSEDLLKSAKKADAWTPSTFEERRLLGDETPLERTESFYSAHSVMMDSWRGTSSDEGDPSEDIDVEQGLRRERKCGKIPDYRKTASFIDYAADSFNSIWFVVFLFTFYIMGAVFIVSFLGATGATTLTCERSFQCTLANTMWSWLAFAVTLSISGILIIVPVSVGNNQFIQKISPILFSMALLFGYSLIPWLEKFFVEVVGVPISGEWEKARSGEHARVVLGVFTISAMLVQIILFKNLIGSLVPRFLVRRYVLLRWLLLPSSILRSALQKIAATNKINVMIENAHKLHRRAHKRAQGSNAEQATMLNFVLHGEKVEGSGGLFWSLRGLLWKGQLTQKEGVWIHARLFVGQVGQIIVFAIISVLWYLGIKSLAESVDTIRQEAVDQDNLGTKYILFWTPSKEDVYYSLIPGGIITAIFLVALILVYLPTTVSMILKFRTGVRPSLRDPNFVRFRGATEGVYYNTGNMIYAFAGSAALLFFIFGGLLFLCFWDPTTSIMLNIIAWGIGITVTVTLKMVLTSCCRSHSIMAFFRTRPGAANISTLMLECWHIGLGGGVLISRLCQFLLAMAFWIGRIDSVFLSDEVDLFGYRFDLVPLKYVSEVLVHEAHRHPYIERMAAMYLMRLRYGEHFGSDAGATWRRIFVETLFPWLLKYRQGYDDDDDDSEDVDDMYPVEDTPKSRGLFRRRKEVPEERVEISGMDAVFRDDQRYADQNDNYQGESTRAVHEYFEGSGSFR